MTTNEIFDIITLALFLLAPFVLAWATLTRTVYWTFLGRALLGWVLSMGIVFLNAIAWRVTSGYVPADDGQPDWWRMVIRGIAIIAAVVAVVAIIRSPQSDDPGRVHWSSLFGRGGNGENGTRESQAAEKIVVRGEAAAEKSAVAAALSEVSATRHEQATEEQREITTELTETIDRVEKQQAAESVIERRDRDDA